MEQRQTIGEISEQIASEMERLQYSPLTILDFRRKAKHLSNYAQEKTGEDYFSEELGQAYLSDTIGFPFEENRWLTSPEAAHIRCVRRIGEYQLHGAVLRNRAKNAKILSGWELGDETIIATYLDSVQTADNSEATKKLRIRHIRQFYEFLASRKVTGVHAISAQIISDYAASLQGSSPVYTKHRLATLRFYFRFLRQNGILECDWSFAVPKVIAPKNMNVPALWEKDDLERLLEGIDRGSPVGKRDYAIILLVVELGLRVTDVSELRLDSLKWERNELELVQHKTGNKVTQPLLENVGWAIIDYIKYARPNVESPFVFLTVNAPYTQMRSASIGCLLDRHRVRCGIEKRRGTAGGMHSLRHALARRLLEQGTPLSTVANVMGHTSYSSTSPYLKVDIEGLRECALSLGEVLTDV